ncbi:MAG: recombinase family protein, partial [Acidobacteria bacterium]|nr:recombinase family protein [Acidobacteriota bacterium]
MPASKNGTAAPSIQAVLYARVSSKDQEKEGYSIPAQQRSLREHALQQGIIVAEEFVDVETAKQSGRTAFTAMMEYLKKHRATCRTILVEKTDRLYRNLKDWTTLDDLGITIHLVKEGRVIGPDSRSSDQLMHGINVLMARNYILNLGEEARKGMLEKARAGTYPSFAPVGYLNADGPGGKRGIVSDPEAAPVITELFERFATGQYSLKALVRESNAEGVKLRGRKLYSSVVHQILRKRIYTGDFDWDGETYPGTHEALVTRERWHRVQELLDARAENKIRKVKHDFAYTGLVHCGHCGCVFVGELKKRKYVYYHCTGNRGKCPEPYTRQEVLTREFAGILRELVIPQPILEWLGDAVLTCDQTEQAAHAQAIKKLQVRYDQIKARIETMYLDKLDGRITQELFDKHSATFRRDQDGLLLKIQDLQKATPLPIDQAVDMLRLTSRASELFLQQSAAEQRRLLQVVVEKAAWQDGTLRTTLFEPFEVLRHSNQESCRKEKDNGGSGRDMELWLPGM